MKDYFDTLMKEQLQKMDGSVEKDWPLELRKFPVTTTAIESPNFESITFEKLKALSSDKPIKLQKIIGYGGNISKLELIFTNELEKAVFQTINSSDTGKEITWDGSK